MMTAFVVCALFGGILLLLGMLGHGHDADVHDLHLGSGGDTDISHDFGHGFMSSLPFFSLRFWAYGLTAFGIIGIVLRLMGGLAPGVVTALAIVSGLIAGWGVVATLRLLDRSSVNSSATVMDLIGMEAQVVVAIRGTNPGRIRLSVKGEVLDLMAISEAIQDLEPGTSVIVAAIENDRARVMPRAALYDDTESLSVKNQ
jgi:hypothetical protein